MSPQNDSPDSFERKTNPGGMRDSIILRRWHEIREGQVFRLEIPRAGEVAYGTGVLIGPDCILTNWHVVEGFDPSSGKIKAVFDYKTDTDGRSIRDATTYELDANCILIHSPYAASDNNPDDESLPLTDELDFAVLHLPEAIGKKRGWCVLSDKVHDFRDGEPLSILQHPEGRPLQMDTGHFTQWNADHTRVCYTTNTEPGSSGSPCLDKNWNLVAIHNAGYRHHNQGIPTQLIRAFLEESGLWSSLRADEKQPDLFKPGDLLRNLGCQGPTVIDLKDYLPERFFGREEDVRIVVEGLEAHLRFALVGHGGIGKTAIAAKSILSVNTELLKDGVVSHNFYQEPSTEAMASSIVRAFVDVNKVIDKPLESLKSLLAHKRPFIYLEGCENAEDKELLQIRELIGSCPFLITTREKKQTIGLQSHEVDSINLESAKDILCHHAGIDDSGSEVESLCETLGRVPLALELAGGWINLNQSSATDLLGILKEEGLSELHPRGTPERSIPLLLGKTAERLSNTALDIWAVLGLDVPQPVSVSVIQSTLKLTDREMRKALAELMNACLMTHYEDLEYGIDDKAHYQLKHRLIYSYGRTELRERLDDNKVEALATRYLSLLADWNIGKGFKNFLHCNELMPHFINASNLRERVLGAEHPATLNSVNNLAFLHSSMGDYEKAKPLYERAAEGFIKKLGKDHPQTKTVLANLERIREKLK
jgi:tetratricopeptide (TPR) repeat protein